MQSEAGAPAEAVLDVSAWARDALALVNDVPGVYRAGLALPEGGGRRLRFTASDRANHERVEWCLIDAYDDVPLNTAVRTGNPVLGTLSHLDQRYADFVEGQLETSTVAIAAVPMIAAEQVVGGFVLFFEHLQEFGPMQRLELARVGEYLGAGLRVAQRAEPAPRIDMSDEQSSPGATVAVHAVADDPAAVSQARRFLRRTLTDWGITEETIDVAVLCLSELVTNAVVHTRAGCVVRVVLEQGILTTTVRDGGTPNAATATPVDDPLQVHGRGLQLVDALVTRWGSDLDTVGTTIWFVLES